MRRKGFIGLALVGVVVLSMSSVFAQYNEAPVLKELVQAGQLPPVEDRLPVNPMVEEPYESIGVYGGTLHRIYTGPADFLNYAKFSGEPLIRFNVETLLPEPNIIDRWEFSQDGKQLTLHIREGIKWSDGVPLTADDLLFSWLDLQLDPQVPVPTVPGLFSGGEPAQIEKKDDFTVVLTWTKPNYMAVYGFRYEDTDKLFPKHYFEQFHPKYNPESTYEKLSEALSYRRFSQARIGVPVLSAWEIVEYVPGDRVVTRRNPYYWKVDPAGNQLPYIDEVVYHYVGDVETIPLRIATGMVTMQARHIRFEDYPFYMDNREVGNYEVMILKADTLAPAIFFNYDCPDLVIRDLILTQEFRKALSLGINRQRIADTLYYGVAEPWPFAPLPESLYYPGDESVQKWVAYSPELADQLLDALGLTKTKDGFRRLPDGRPLQLVVEVAEGEAMNVSLLELVKEDWRQIGVDLVIDVMDRSLLVSRLNNMDPMAWIWKVDSPHEFLINLNWWIPAGVLIWSQPMKEYVRWYLSKGSEGREPLDWVKEVLGLYEKAIATEDIEERAAFGKQIAQIYGEQVVHLGTTTLPMIAIRSKVVGNVPPTYVAGDIYRDEGLIRPWQFYIKQ